jgi:hypothetical protein
MEVGRAEIDHAADCRGRPWWPASVRRGKGGLESFDFAEPVVLAGFIDAFNEVGADVCHAGLLGGVGAQEWATDVPLMLA